MHLIVKHNFSQWFMMQKQTYLDIWMGIHLIKKIADDIANSAFPVAAIAMSPELHIQLVHENLYHGGHDNQQQELNIDRTVCNTPIIFVSGGNDHYKLLDSEGYRLTRKLNDLLRIYGEKYNNFKVFINHSDKLSNGDSEQLKLIETLRDLSNRIEQAELKIGLLSQ